MMRRVLDVLSVLLVLAGLLWVAVPSSVFLRPDAMLFADGTTTLVRRTPFGLVMAEWQTEIEVLKTNLECRDAGTSTYQPIPGDTPADIVADTVQWPTSAHLTPCLGSERPLLVRVTWRVVSIRGWPLPVPLRPVSLSATLD